MKYNYLLIGGICLPVIFILINISFIYKINKSLEFKSVSIKYQKISPQREETGIRKSTGRGGSLIFFTSEEGNSYRRQYIGILLQSLANKTFNRLEKESPKEIGLYVNPNDLLTAKKNIPYFSLDNGKEKKFSYYLDIFSYVKYKYSILFIITYFTLLIFLFYFFMKSNMNDPLLVKILIVDLALIVLYMLF